MYFALSTGTLYMIFKHLVDKYNIYFAYGRSVISKKIHTTAINFVIVSIVCLQLSLLFFSLLRQGLKKDLTIYSIVLLIITCLVFVTHNTLHWFKELSPVEYKVIKEGNTRNPTAVITSWEKYTNRYNYDVLKIPCSGCMGSTSSWGQK